jgi:colicin import membrane protein
MHLLKGNLEQAAYNLIAASCKVTEETFFNIEKARELKEKKRRESLRIERLEKLMSVCEDASIYPLGDISEDAFNDLYLGMLSQKEAKLKAEKEAEEKRLAEIEAEKKRQAERDAENLRLKKEAELREIEIEKERQKQAEILAKQKAESEKKAKEEKEKAEAKEKQLVAEREKAESERKKIEEAAKKEREEADRKLKAEQEKARIEAEKAKAEKDKLEAELKAEADKKENERKAKEAAEKKAKNAPDKEKLLEFAINIDNIAIPEIKSEEAQKILADVKMLLSKVSVFIREKSSGL